MNDPDNFLSRWSRRKREAKAHPEEDARQPSETPPHDEGVTGQAPASESSGQPPLEFDVDSLPPIDSIGADSDISAFLREGVPDALRHAALRRVWSTDPAIRDFMGPTENYWDAAGPDGVPGFGPLDPGLDVKRMVAELFGETTPAELKPEAPVSAAVSAPPNEIDEARADGRPAPDEEQDRLPHRLEDAATQKDPGEAQPARKIARRHGSAIPQ